MIRSKQNGRKTDRYESRELKITLNSSGSSTAFSAPSHWLSSAISDSDMLPSTTVAATGEEGGGVWRWKSETTLVDEDWQ